MAAGQERGADDSRGRADDAAGHDDDDVTRLSSRARGTDADDVTRLSQRARGARTESDGRASSRGGDTPAGDDEDADADDATRLSSRARASSSAQTLSRDTEIASPPTAASATDGPAGQGALPPDYVARETREGDFGDAGPEYEPRPAPAVPAAPGRGDLARGASVSADADSGPLPDEAVLAPDEAERRRERERRRLGLSLVGAGLVIAALVTAGIAAIVWLALGFW